VYPGAPGSSADAFPVDPVKWEYFKNWFLKALNVLLHVSMLVPILSRTSIPPAPTSHKPPQLRSHACGLLVDVAAHFISIAGGFMHGATCEDFAERARCMQVGMMWDSTEPHAICGFAVTRETAEALLMVQPTGTFLVRLSSQQGALAIR